MGGWGRSGGAAATAPAGGANDIAAREAALNAREQALRAREEALGMQENNWPPCELAVAQLPLLKLTSVFPFLRHQLSDLPQDHQPVMKFLYTQWLALIVTLILNLLGCIFLLIAGSSEGG